MADHGPGREAQGPRTAPSDLAIIGRYVLTPDIFAILAETAPDAPRARSSSPTRSARSAHAAAHVRRRVRGQRYDTGDKLGFLKATVEFALARPDLADAFREYLETLKL